MSQIMLLYSRCVLDKKIVRYLTDLNCKFNLNQIFSNDNFFYFLTISLFFEVAMEVLFAADETENESEGNHYFNGESLSMQSRKPFTHLQLEALEEGEEQPTKHFRESLKPKSKKKTCHRRRRRSSARFLRLTQPGDDDEEDEGDDEEQIPETEQLGELYQRAIRMNAENRINAGNSWNIKLIENMDKLTSDGPNVNFTKASCTLDASVKIYSYVHLTSYKVLANLNRNDAMENKTSNQSSKRSKESLVSSLEKVPESNGNNMDDEQRMETEHKRTETLETNICK
jgi:Condensin complex subunit 2